MYRIKQDQRTIRSSQLIYDAVTTLSREKAFSKISVTEVVEKAQVGRTTFYRCFDEIEDVLRMRCNQVFDELIAYVKAYRLEGNRLNKTVILKPILRYFYLNSEIIDLLLRAQRLDILQETFQERAAFVKAQLVDRGNFSEPYLAYIIKIRISLMCTILAHWVETGKREAPDELADTLMELMARQETIVDYM